VEAALFAMQNPLSQGVILADEVGLGKTIEAGLVIAQHWAERKRNILVIVPANLRKQWHQELLDKFSMDALILEARNYNSMRKSGVTSPFTETGKLIICSYQFAKAKAADLQRIQWNLVVFDEAHRLRNVYKSSNVIARTLRDALAHAQSRVLLTATPLQNSLMELYGLVSMIDERVFGDEDSFRSQYVHGNRTVDFISLRQRIAPLCKRTLRQQVQQYINYTKRIPIVEEFRPSSEELFIRNAVLDYLIRPEMHALPRSQRQLITMVLMKLLASSTHAIAGALATMANRLQKLLDQSPNDFDDENDLVESLDKDYEILSETAEEWNMVSEPAATLSAADRQAITEEMAELRYFSEKAAAIRDNSKGKALLTALDRAFAELVKLGAPPKAIIFTESRKTQEYLLSLLQDTSYGEGIVLFNGTNTSDQAKAVYKQWLNKHDGSDRISGSKTADTRAALVEHFRDNGSVMIATEAGAEGINLQFASLVINYDLPWNPQRIEQRIGRAHRYGQKHDVVVVNFIDLTNDADRRVYELLAHKFQLFEGVFGASDEVLGAIGSGVDFERRIADIYRDCRDPETIRNSFEQLQLDLAGEISTAMLKTREILFEHFDEKVLESVKTSSEQTRNRYERMLLDLTTYELGDHASFDDAGFTLHKSPSIDISAGWPLGRYELPRRTGEAHLYRIGHPLAAWVIRQAKDRELAAAKLVFDYDAYGSHISTLKTLRGESGQLVVKLVTIEALGKIEEHLLVAGTTDSGKLLLDDDAEKLLRLPVTKQATCNAAELSPLLAKDVTTRLTLLVKETSVRNLHYFEQEVEKLDGWVDDLKHGLEYEIKNVDKDIKEARRAAAVAPTLDEKLKWQKQQRDQESKRNKLRRELYERQDEVEAKRNELIAGLEGKLEQKIIEKDIFTIDWSLV
jgi:ERCC4-related helicase